MTNSGELCTNHIADILNIYTHDTYGNIIIDSKYIDLKTYSSNYDDPKTQIKTLCTTRDLPDDTGSNMINHAYPYCMLEFGMGTIRESTSDPSKAKCVTYDCPTGWERDNMNCKKPLEDSTLDKQARCDERWYDWFTIPNYHLGNKYQSDANSKCYEPCKPGYVPYYMTDPVDGQSLYYFGQNTDKIDNCVPKHEYLMGKYADNNDYCPLPIIYKINTNTVNVISELTRLYSDYRNRNDININDNELSLLTESKQKQAYAQSIADKATLQSSDIATSTFQLNEAEQQACDLLNTPERIKTAYSVCKDVKNDSYTIKSGNSDAIMPVLKSACHSLFCNDNSDALNYLDTATPICFSNPGNIDPKKIDEEPQPPDPPNSDAQQSFVINSIITAFFLILIVVEFILLYYCFTDLIWPLLRKVWIPISIFIFNNTTGRFGTSKKEWSKIDVYLKQNEEQLK